ncbi:MAG: histidine kinase [Actinomycetota bacterium]
MEVRTAGRSAAEDEPVTEGLPPRDSGPFLERALARAGIPAHVAGIITATPSLRLPWLAAAAAVSLFATWGASTDPERILLFLLVAPVVPVAGVAAAYGPWADPMFETVRSTPISGFQVLLARSVAVIATAVGFLGVASLAVPGVAASSWAWVLPALALTISSLVLSTFTSLPRAAAVVTGAWCVAVAAAGALGDPYTLFRGPGQLSFLTLALGASLMIVRRRERFEVEGLRARRELVDAADAERRRIERNIHDGAQQQLVAIGVKAGLARAFVTKDPDRAIAIIDEVRADAQEALEGIRDMTRGDCPPILADEGLAAAIALKAKRSSVPVTIEADGVGRLEKQIEIAVYFCCLEAMQNAAKYSRASSLIVTIRHKAGELVFSICDDGVGFDPSTMRRGVGMRSMAERTEALEGRLEVRSALAGGTVITGRVPLAL